MKDKKAHSSGCFELDDLISRNKAIEALGKKPLAWEQGEYEEGLQAQWESDVEAIKNMLPEDNEEYCKQCLYFKTRTAEPIRMKGHWVDGLKHKTVKVKNGLVYHDYGCYCSVCGERLEGSYHTATHGNYCPNCGADMETEGITIKAAPMFGVNPPVCEAIVRIVKTDNEERNNESST